MLIKAGIAIAAAGCLASCNPAPSSHAAETITVTAISGQTWLKIKKALTAVAKQHKLDPTFQELDVKGIGRVNSAMLQRVNFLMSSNIAVARNSFCSIDYYDPDNYDIIIETSDVDLRRAIYTAIGSAGLQKSVRACARK